MDEESQRRVGANEALLREVNEAIERGQWPGEEDSRVAFRCECASLTCDQVLELSIGEYERVRAHPRRFLIARGHEVAEKEMVLETRPGYAVVEKRGRAGVVADATDPRD